MAPLYHLKTISGWRRMLHSGAALTGRPAGGPSCGRDAATSAVAALWAGRPAREPSPPHPDSDYPCARGFPPTVLCV